MTSIINTAKVPIALKSQNRWVAWKYETKDGRATKIPYSAANGGSLRRASTIDPKTWCGFFQAKRFSEEHSMAGIGFCFEGSGIAGVDFDGCRDPKSGVIDEWALNEIRKLDSYSEISPSNSGVKVFVRGQLPGLRAKAVSQNGGHGGKMRAIELYDSGRYFAVTGNALPELPAAVEARDLTNLYHRVKKALSSSPAATISSIAKIPSGQRHGFLLTHAGKLLQRGIGLEALEVELLRFNREMFQEPKDEATIRKQAQDFFRRWQVSPALVLTGARQQPITEEQEFSVSIKMLSEVEARPVRWFWEPFVPLGMLSMLSGESRRW